MSNGYAGPDQNLGELLFPSVGFMYTAGALGASVSQFLKGFRYSTNGNRIISGIRNARINAPLTATSLGVWAGCVFPLVSAGVLCLREKDDPWSSIIGAAGTGMLYKSRQGLGAASKMGLRCGAAVCIIDCGLFVFDKTIHNIRRQWSSGRTDSYVLQPMLAHTSEWFGSLFGDNSAEKMRVLLPPTITQWLDPPLPSSGLNHSATIIPPLGSLENSGIDTSTGNLDEDCGRGRSISTLDVFRCIGLGCMMGPIGGYSYHFMKTFRNASNGNRFIGGLHTTCLNAPRAAASFGLWGGGILIAYEFAIRSLGQEDKLWNSSTVVASISHSLFNKLIGPQEQDEPSVLITDTRKSFDQTSTATTFKDK